MEINITDLSKKYDKEFVLKAVSLHMKPGNTYALIGRNGAGKSTLMNIVANLIKPTSGRIEYDKNIYDELPTEIKSRMGIMTDIPSIIEELTAYQHLKLMGNIHNIPNSECNDRIENLLHFFFPDEKNIRKKTMKNFSTGMKKIMELCSACLHTPDFLILDEPFTGLDPSSSENVIEFLQTYQKPNRTILLSSHSIEYIKRIDSSLILLNNGTIQFEGSVSEFIKDAGKTFHETLLEELGYQKRTSGFKWL